jgi:hypothetical protein
MQYGDKTQNGQTGDTDSIKTRHIMDKPETHAVLRQDTERTNQRHIQDWDKTQNGQTRDTGSIETRHRMETKKAKITTQTTGETNNTTPTPKLTGILHYIISWPVRNIQLSNVNECFPFKEDVFLLSSTQYFYQTHLWVTRRVTY